MNSVSTPADDADLDLFLARKSALSADYANLEPVEVAPAVDAKISAAAKAAVRQAARAALAASGTGPQAAPGSAGQKRALAAAVELDEDGEDQEVDETPPPRRPRWIVPAAVAVGVLLAAGVGFAVLDTSPAVREGNGGMGSLFARRVRERSEAESAAAEAAAQAEAEAREETLPPPPPPFFEFDGPQVGDLDAAIALIRRELIMAREREALADTAQPASTPADSASGAAPADATSSVIQPRDRRLAKILELYDSGNPFLAEDALEIFLRDFADDPISQRILGGKP